MLSATLFQGEGLDGCQNFFLPDREIGVMYLQHNGENSWGGGKFHTFIAWKAIGRHLPIIIYAYITTNLSINNVSDWIRIVLDDSTFLQCTQGLYVDENEIGEPNCTKYVSDIDPFQPNIFEVQLKTRDCQGCGIEIADGERGTLTLEVKYLH